jgi:Arc/MetJ-type ribon-helix-helix transcriptional regulator
MQVELPPEVRSEVAELVAMGEFADERAAVVELVRVGLSYRYRRSPRPSLPQEPRELPPRPGLPEDVNWMGRNGPGP